MSSILTIHLVKELGEVILILSGKLFNLFCSSKKIYKPADNKISVVLDVSSAPSKPFGYSFLINSVVMSPTANFSCDIKASKKLILWDIPLITKDPRASFMSLIASSLVSANVHNLAIIES